MYLDIVGRERAVILQCPPLEFEAQPVRSDIPEIHPFLDHFLDVTNSIGAFHKQRRDRLTAEGLDDDGERGRRQLRPRFREPLLVPRRDFRPGTRCDRFSLKPFHTITRC